VYNFLLVVVCSIMCLSVLYRLWDIQSRIMARQSELTVKKGYWKWHNSIDHILLFLLACGLHLFSILYHFRHRYLENIVTLISRLESLSLRIYAIYRPGTIFAADSMGLSSFTSTQRAPEKAFVRRSVTVVRSSNSKSVPIESAHSSTSY